VTIIEPSSQPIATTTNEQVVSSLQNYLYLGRRVSLMWKENLAVCILRIASWAVFYIPASAVYVTSHLILSKNPSTDAWSKRLTTIAYGERYPALRTWDERLPEDQYVSPNRNQGILEKSSTEGQNLLKAFEHIPSNSAITRVYPIRWGVGRGGQSLGPDSELGSVWKNDFGKGQGIPWGTPMKLEGGGKALLLVYTCEDWSWNFFRTCEGYDRSDSVYQCQRAPMKDFVDGGNVVHPITWFEKLFWIDCFGVLPPDLYLLLSKHKQA